MGELDPNYWSGMGLSGEFPYIKPVTHPEGSSVPVPQLSAGLFKQCQLWSALPRLPICNVLKLEIENQHKSHPPHYFKMNKLLVCIP